MPQNTNFTNDVNVNGYIFSAKIRTGVASQNSKYHAGEHYASATINVATDEDATCVIPVDMFAYENRLDRKTNQTVRNSTYDTIINLVNAKTYETCGKEADKTRITGSLACNDFYSNRTNQMVTTQRVNGSYMHNDFRATVEPATFDVKIAAVKVSERQDGNGVDVRGYAFNFSGSRMFPVIFSCDNPDGVDFLLSLDASTSHPVMLHVWGNVTTTLVERKQTEAESTISNGFGVKASVRPGSARTVNTWAILGATTDDMPEFGSEEPFTVKSFKEMMDSRNVYLESLKQRAMTRQTVGSYGVPSTQYQSQDHAQASNMPFDIAF